MLNSTDFLAQHYNLCYVNMALIIFPIGIVDTAMSLSSPPYLYMCAHAHIHYVMYVCVCVCVCSLIWMISWGFTTSCYRTMSWCQWRRRASLKHCSFWGTSLFSFFPLSFFTLGSIFYVYGGVFIFWSNYFFQGLYVFYTTSFLPMCLFIFFFLYIH